MVQVQSWGVVDAQQLKGHVLLNGGFIDQTSQEVDDILKSISADIHLPDVMGANLTSALSMYHWVLKKKDKLNKINK